MPPHQPNTSPNPPSTWLITTIRHFLITHRLLSSRTRPLTQLFDTLDTPRTILLAGLDCAGKSTILKKHISQRAQSATTAGGRDGGVHSFYPGRFFLVEQAVVPACSAVRFRAVDVGGGRPPSFFDMEGEQFEGADAVVFVVDGADGERVVEAGEELVRGLRRVRQGVPVLCLVNKMDLENAGDPMEIAKQMRVDKIMDLRYPWLVQGCSVVTGQGLYEGFSWIRERLDAALCEKATVQATDASKSIEKH